MIQESATVIRIEGNDTWVQTQRKSACGQCAANKGCGTSVLSNVVGKKIATLRVINPIDAQVGDEVVIGLNESALVRGALITYLLPLLMMIVAALLGQFLAEKTGNQTSELFVILFAAGGFMIAMYLMKIYSRHIQYNQDFQPVILAKMISTG